MRLCVNAVTDRTAPCRYGPSLPLSDDVRKVNIIHQLLLHFFQLTGVGPVTDSCSDFVFIVQKQLTELTLNHCDSNDAPLVCRKTPTSR